MITYMKGNLLDAKEKYIAHGCNAQGVMGKGVAKAIKDKYPRAFEDYRAYYEDYIAKGNHTGLPLGLVIAVDTNIPNPGERIVFNLITQKYYYGFLGLGVKVPDNGEPYVSYDAIASCFKNLNTYMLANSRHGATVGIPKIGAGLGGGDWEIIAKIIERCAPDLDFVVYEL